ncbi:MAG: beta-lactamase family protein [Lachnospiraceae bacterium]|nr:beta-lactamase family protein [Lachnospiraceae bacterium]
MQKVIAGVLAILLLVVSGTTTVFAAENSEQTPSGIACSDLEKHIEDYIDVRKETTSSVSVTVFNGTDDIVSVIYGDANTKDNIRADKDTVYEWGSISKMFVWTSVMQLCEQEKIDLNADVRNYLPDGFLSNLSYKEPVTMLHLMNHTAGFQETVWDVEVTDKEKIISLKDALLSTAPAQIYEPGRVVSYSNWGAALAAYTVECVSGMDYADYVRKNIFEPLGMERTAIRPDCSDNTWVESQREKTNAYYNVQGEYEDYGECRRYILLYPAGSAAGTMSDLVRFAKAFLQDTSECPLFTQPDTLAEMLSPTLNFSGTDTPRICHGLFSQRYGVSLIGHAGNTTGFSANLVIDTEGGTGIVVMTNEVGETAYNYGLVSLVYGDCKAETEFTYEDLSGIYLNSRANFKNSFTKLYSMISGLLPISKGETEGSFTAAMVGTVTQISKDACVMDDGNGLKTYLSIQRDDNGNVVALQHMTGMDFQKENLMLFVIKIIFFFLFVLSSLWMFPMLIVHGITLHKFKQTGIWKNKVYQLLAELFMVLASILIYWLILPPLMGASLAKEQVIVKCMMIIILSLAEAAVLVLGIFGSRDKKLTKKGLRQRTGLIVTRISGIVLIASVLYWRFYQFWGC